MHTNQLHEGKVSADGLPGFRVLVIDESADLRETMAKVLELYGFRVSLASDGEEGLQQFGKDPADAVVVDLWLPRMDGFGVCRSLLQVSEATPFLVALTGWVNAAIRAQAAAVGFDEFLVKPCHPAYLVDVLMRGCAERRRTGLTGRWSGEGPRPEQQGAG